MDDGGNLKAISGNSKCHLSVTITGGRGAKEEILKVENRKRNGLIFAWIDAGFVAVTGRILHRHRIFSVVYIVNSFRTNISLIFAAKQGAERNGACHGGRNHVTTGSATRGQGHGQKCEILYDHENEQTKYFEV
ncbi:MAG: hypothetical protein WCS94_00340 [Verrucomicrobiota bacterium]